MRYTASTLLAASLLSLAIAHDIETLTEIETVITSTSTHDESYLPVTAPYCLPTTTVVVTVTAGQPGSVSSAEAKAGGAGKEVGEKEADGPGAHRENNGENSSGAEGASGHGVNGEAGKSGPGSGSRGHESGSQGSNDSGSGSGSHGLSRPNGSGSHGSGSHSGGNPSAGHPSGTGSSSSGHSNMIGTVTASGTPASAHGAQSDSNTQCRPSMRLDRHLSDLTPELVSIPPIQVLQEHHRRTALGTHRAYRTALVLPIAGQAVHHTHHLDQPGRI